MAYADVYATARDATFVGRVYIAIREVARDVAAESGATPLHSHRLTLAKAVLRDTDTWANVAALLLAEAGRTTGSTDAVIKSSITAGWDSVVREVYWGGSDIA